MLTLLFNGLRENLLATLYRKMGGCTPPLGKHTSRCVKKLQLCTHVKVRKKCRHTKFQTNSVIFDVVMTSSILRHLYRKLWVFIGKMDIFHKINVFAHLIACFDEISCKRLFWHIKTAFRPVSTAHNRFFEITSFLR